MAVALVGNTGYTRDALVEKIKSCEGLSCAKGCTILDGFRKSLKDHDAQQAKNSTTTAKPSGEKTMAMIAKAEEKKEDRFINIDVGVEKKGTKIVLPSEPFPMDYDEAIKALERRKAEEETTIKVHETVPVFPLDGAYCFMLAMQEIYGWASPQPTPGWFGMKNPPTTVNLEIDHGVYTQVLWGGFAIPNVDGLIQCGIAEENGRRVFCISGTIKKKFQEEIKRLADKTREIAKTKSVYRGKAIKLRTDEDDGSIDYENPPGFLDLINVRPEELTFSRDTETQIKTNLFTLIEHTDACRKNQIPLKRGVLLEGPFGTGKTLTAFVCAKICRENGWTFVMVDRSAGLNEALAFARQYQPAVVFSEDVDRAASGERTQEIDDILNIIDGIESKGTEIITVLTSNEVSNINRAMLRPGRLDAIISVGAPDAEAAIRLVKLYARGLLNENEDLTEVGKELNGQIPAVIREVIERSKLYALSRSKGKDAKLLASDLVYSAKGMKRHLELLYPKLRDEKDTPQHRLGQAFMDNFKAGIDGHDMLAKVKKVESVVEQINSRLN